MKNKYLKLAKISEVKFRVIVVCFSQDIPATKSARLARVNRNTAQRIYSLLRERITALAHSENEPFAGEIEIDESYFGGTNQVNDLLFVNCEFLSDDPLTNF